MKQLIEQQAVHKIPDMLSELLGISEDEITLHRHTRTGKSRPDLVANVGEYTFIVEFKSYAAKAPLLSALEQLSDYVSNWVEDTIPLVVVPFMGKVGQRLCDEYEVSWLDLSGNAHIEAPGLLIHVEGKPNRFKKVGRPPNIFSPKSSRIARQLLIQPNREFTQREIAQTTGLGEGYTSRIIRRLEHDQLITRTDRGTVLPSNPDLLLDTWYEVYEFSRHDIIKGHITARSGEELLRRIEKTLTRKNVEYAATGLGAAWLCTHFAAFRIATFFLRFEPNGKVLEELGFRREERGANTWLVVSNDKGVFQGSKTREGIRCVHPVQIYLDLKDHPERASEAAAELRRENLNWRKNA
jgi:hypothetical protein